MLSFSVIALSYSRKYLLIYLEHIFERNKQNDLQQIVHEKRMLRCKAVIDRYRKDTISQSHTKRLFKDYLRSE